MKRLLFVYPSIANNPEIIKSIAILDGIARKHSWETKYFDTYVYENSEVSVTARESSGEFKPSSQEESKMKPHIELVADLQDIINSFRPDIIAISCNSYEYEHLLAFLPKVIIPKETKIIIGGVHCVLKPDEVADTGLFDMVCVGDGEEAFDEILTKIDKNLDISHTENIFFRNKESGEVIKNLRKRLIDENILWTFKPRYSFFSDGYFKYPYHGKIYRRFRFEVGRGCPYHCTYCANSALKGSQRGLGKYFRARPLETMKEDMETMLSEYEIEMFHMDDECLLSHSSKWLNDLFDWYGRVVKKPFILQTRPETVTEEKVEILKKSNAPFFLVKMGVESGSEKILKNVCKRGTTVEQITNAYKILHKHDISSGACFIIGFPYETREDIFKTIDLCRRIKPEEMIVNIFQPMIGQELRDVCIKEGFIDKDDKPCLFTEKSILKMPQISQDEIEGLRRVFSLYATLPEKYYEEIELCEKDYDGNKKLYKKLVELRWNLSQ